MEDFIKIAAATPKVRPAAVEANLESMLRLAAEADAAKADILLFPELSLTGYTCADLFYMPDLLSAAEDALSKFVKETAAFPFLAVAGLPVRADGRIYDCAAVSEGGRILGVVPKSYLPSSREFYEARWFASAAEAVRDTVEICGESVPFGNDLVFAKGRAAAGVEICEDMWTACPPSTRLALRGANVILNPSASNELVGKTEYRRSLVAGQSARCICAYAYSGAGPGESTTDMVFGGHALVAENGTVLAEGERFSFEPHLTVADVDVGFLEFERSANCAFRKAGAPERPVRRIAAGPQRPRPDGEPTERVFDPHPFVPSSRDNLDCRCSEVLSIQSVGLATRLSAIGAKDAVVGLSGGLDSALALLVCVDAFDRLGLPRRGIRAYTLPGFGTTGRTQGNAGKLAKALGVSFDTVDICDVVRRHLADLGRDESVKDVTYENAQARARTYFLMDKANDVGGILVGTGDLSELALGWCTYNGDHMSMYGVNAGVPKTLARHIVGWYASAKTGGVAREALLDILDTPVSPELLPACEDGSIAQKTEDKVGPYELHDFFLYHRIRRGAAPSKILALAKGAFKGAYSADVISKWLAVFMRRFRTQQFKRNCMPDGPKVGSLNLSPRGDWRMPSDAC